MEQKKQYNLYQKFIKFFLKKGKATVAIKIMNNVLFFFSKKYKVTSYFFLLHNQQRKTRSLRGELLE
jgi:hypothetical protein